MRDFDIFDNNKITINTMFTCQYYFKKSINLNKQLKYKQIYLILNKLLTKTY